MKSINYKDIIKVGSRNEKFVVVELPFKKIKSSGGCGVWKVSVKCDCGNQQCVPCVDWKRGKYKKCRSCQIVGSSNYAWNGYGEINGQVFCKIKLNASRIGVNYDLSKEYLWELFLKQNRKCALTGLELKFRFNNGEQTASLDRIDSLKGYVKGNVQWIHKDVNRMKNSFSENHYLNVCKLVYEHNRNRI